jgi:hypothetical protein
MAFFETGLVGRLPVTHLVGALLVNGISGLRLELNQDPHSLITP